MTSRALLLGLSAAVVFCACGLAHADPINGTVYTNQAPFDPSKVLAAPTGSAAATFTVSNINFFTNAPSPSPGYTIGAFLGANLTSVLPPSVALADLNNTIFDFTGHVFLNAGTYTITHDDGMYLFLNTTYVGKITGDDANNRLSHPGEVINAGKPVSATGDSFTIAAGDAGLYSFDLLYTEVNGTPATLQATNFPIASTPEPESLALMGTGMMGLVAVLRRRRNS